LLGGGTDIALDEGRSRLYLTSSALNQVQVYSLAQNKFLSPVATDTEPIAAAISRSGKFLYVTCFADSVVDVIDLTSLTVTNRISLPSKPQGIAVASDERVLISTIGPANVLLLYDPTPNAANPLSAINQTPVPALPPTFPAPSSRAFLAAHSQLRATRDGSFIAGLHVTNAGSGVGVLFVYQASSGTVLRARTWTSGFLSALAISDDGSRIMCGANLFEASTLKLLGTMNTANATFPITPGSSFATQPNQGGAVFSPDGTTLYSVLNVSPVNQAGNVGQLMLTDPDNLSIKMGIQAPEFFAGKMVVSGDGANGYALSDSGFVTLPFSTILTSPLAVPSPSVLLLSNDQCGVSGTSTLNVAINSPGKVKGSVSPLLLQFSGLPNQPSPATAPGVRSAQGQLSFTFNTSLTKGYGTVNPPHDFQLQSSDAINIPDRVRVYQNTRDADARGTIVPIATGIGTTPQLNDLIYDAPRNRIYIANTGLNRVEVYDIGQQQLLTPIKVGQLPISMALTPDGTTLYVANSGGESISIVDPDKMVATGLVGFPPIQFASNLPPIQPSVIAAGLSGLEILMSNGQLWRVVGNVAEPRGVSTIIGSNAATGAPNTIPAPASAAMASSPEGRYILLAAANGFIYL
jgi:DNA-binding beta-propeller fold protein YncE